MARTIGVISDTHGLLRGEVTSGLRGCDMILHAGDIGDLSVLTELRQIAEVVAVRGNVDTGRWAKELKKEEFVEVNGHRICIVHDISTLTLDPASAGIDIVIYGHSHQPAVEWRAGILYLNPGSAGPKRYHLPVAMAILCIRDEEISPEIVEVQP